MHRSTPYLCLVALLALSAPLFAAEQPKGFFFQKGDRIVFLGDSITEQYEYSSDIELYLTTRFPGAAMTFLNAGIGGDTAWGGAHRFAAHVLAEKPTALTIDFGMNDGGYGAFNAATAKNFLTQTEDMLKAALKDNVRVALISPNAVEVRSNPRLKTYLETQQKFYAPLKELADKHKVAFVDQYAVTRRVLEKLAADNAKIRPFPDGVHTNGAGGLLMAHTILTGLKAPAIVSAAAIDIAAKETKTTDCTVEELKIQSDGVSFRRKDKALPLPVQEDWLPILPYVNDLKDLNYYELKIKGLSDGKYSLSIDGITVGEYTAGALSKGINLGNLRAGPLFVQGQQVRQLIGDKNKAVYSRFLNVVRFDPPSWFSDAMKQAVKDRKPLSLKQRMEKIQDMQEKIYKKAQPESHHFELKAMK